MTYEKWANKLSNDELEVEYYAAVFESLGSETEDMYERGYDMVDIRERDKYEQDLVKKANILEKICVQRGIKLWNNMTS